MVDTAPKSRRTAAIISALIVAIIAIVVAVVLVTREGSRDSADLTQSAEVAGQTEETGEEDAEVATSPQTQTAPQAQEEPAEVDLTVLESREDADPLALGPVDAPVGMVIFSDYQCGYCAKWNQETLPVLLDYVDQGKLRIEWHHTVFFGAGSEAAAKASYAAGLQGKYLEYNNALFPQGQTLSAEALTSANLIALAGSLGLDEDQFAADMNSTQTAERIGQDSAFAQQVGVSSTPTFAVAGVPVVGAQPAEVFVQTIDQALAAGK